MHQRKYRATPVADVGMLVPTWGGVAGAVGWGCKADEIQRLKVNSLLP